MAVSITIKWRASGNRDTIWNKLAARLGREPTDQEATNEVRRILRDEPIAQASALGREG